MNSSRTSESPANSGGNAGRSENAGEESGRGPLAVLLVASLEGAESLLEQLRRGGYEPKSRRVDSRENLLEALKPGAWDVAICSDDLAVLEGPAALRLIKATCPELPVILVSSAFGESVAAAAMKAGADDFVSSGFLARLVPAIERETRLVATRRDWARATDSLRETEDLYRDLVEHSEVLICVHDLEGRILTVNEAAERSLGYTRQEHLGREILTIQDILAPEGREGFRLYLEKIRTEGSAKGIMPVLNIRGERRYWQYHNTLRTEGVDSPIVRGLAFDVTDRLRAEEKRCHAEQALRESQAFLEKAQEIGRIGSWISDASASGRLTWSRETCRIFGIDEETFDGRVETFFERVHPEDREGVLSASRAALEEGAPYSTDHRIVLTDGSVRWVHERADIERGSDGRPLRMVGTVQDITEQRQLEEQLRQAQKMEAIGRLAGGIAHDFNNLLTAILGYSEVMLGRLRSDDPLREDAEEIRKAGERAAALTRQLLAFSRKQRLEPKVLDVNDLLRNLQKMLRRMIGEDLELLTSLAPDVGRVKADPGQLEQVVINLAVNARDAMPRGGRLTIETSNAELDPSWGLGGFAVTPGPYVMITVTDTGTGMDEATKSHVFEPFFTTKGQGKGTGLGLATVYGIVKQSGGYIWMDSQPEKGTAFRVCLPRHEAPADRETAAPPVSPEKLRGRETILLVEDEEGVRSLARKILSRQGYTILEASGPQEALELIEGHAGPIQLLLTDVVMPEMNGPELSLLVAALRPEIRVLFISGYTDAAVRGDFSAKDRLFLGKPFSPEALAKKVREALDG